MRLFRQCLLDADLRHRVISVARLRADAARRRNAVDPEIALATISKLVIDIRRISSNFHEVGRVAATGRFSR
jgi:hypothetical protein